MTDRLPSDYEILLITALIASLPLARQAGFVNLRTSTSTVSYTEPAAVQAWADAYAEAMLQSNFAEKASEYGLATRSDLAGISTAWRSWCRDADAFFCFSQTEVVAWKQ